jgi:hypothetical protein
LLKYGGVEEREDVPKMSAPDRYKNRPPFLEGIDGQNSYPLWRALKMKLSSKNAEQ